MCILFLFQRFETIGWISVEIWLVTCSYLLSNCAVTIAAMIVQTHLIPILRMHVSEPRKYGIYRTVFWISAVLSFHCCCSLCENSSFAERVWWLRSLCGKRCVLCPAKKKAKPKKKKGGSGWNSECYHAGMSAVARKNIQEDFMSGRLRIVVATVAFGMGLDKSNIRGIVHFNMPKNIESYIQEIGRAGRDGQVAFCHLFLDCKVI